MDSPTVKSMAANPKRHSRNVSSSKTMPARTHLGEDEVDPLAVAPALPERPPVKQQLSEPDQQLEALPSQLLKDFSHLLRPENFHPLTGHGVPPPFRDPDLSHLASPQSIPALLEGGYFRAAAVEAANTLTSSPAPPVQQIFHLLFIRLTCLILLGQLAQAAQESRCLQDISSPFYLTSGSERENILPWELRILVVRLQSISISDLRKAVAGYYDLAREVRVRLSAASSEDVKLLWRQRLFDLSIRVANALIETGDLIGAARHLETLNVDLTPATDRKLICGRLGLLYLRIGNLSRARKYIVGAQDSDIPSNGYADLLRPLLSIAEGNYGSAATQLDATKNVCDSGASLSKTNLAVALLYAGNLKKSKELLEELLADGMRFPTLLFNLATVFELCTEKARNSKVQLAEAASKQKDSLGYERSLVDFKL